MSTLPIYNEPTIRPWALRSFQDAELMRNRLGSLTVDWPTASPDKRNNDFDRGLHEVSDDAEPL